MKNLTFVLFLSFILTGCAMQAPTASAVSNDFTLGKVQSQLKKGMSSSQVVSLLGSPSVSGAGAGSSGNFFGIFGGGRSKSSNSSKNLTLIVKLNADGVVTDYKYQSIKY